MSKELPAGHGAGAHKDKMGKVMHEFKRGQLHSGTGETGKKGKVVKNRDQAIAIGLSYVEKLMAMGYSEEAALTFAEFAYNETLAMGIAGGMMQTAAFIDSQQAADAADEGPTSDINSTPGKQKGNSGRQKQSQQGSVAEFPTLPKETDTPHSEGPMVKARKGKCPTGTRSVGGGFCKNPKPGKRQYFDKVDGKGCPPGSKPAGKGRCSADFAEPGTLSQGAAQSAAKSIQDTPCEKKKREPGQPKKEKATPTKPTAPTQPNQPTTPEQQMVKDAAKKRAEQCSKQTGN
jgi:hypothetical protein